MRVAVSRDGRENGQPEEKECSSPPSIFDICAFLGPFCTIVGIKQLRGPAVQVVHGDDVIGVTPNNTTKPSSTDPRIPILPDPILPNCQLHHKPSITNSITTSNTNQPAQQSTSPVTMKVTRTPALRAALRPSLRQAPRIQPAQTRLATTGPGSPPPVGDKGTAKVYNKDGTNPNKNLVYVPSAHGLDWSVLSGRCY